MKAKTVIISTSLSATLILTVAIVLAAFLSYSDLILSSEKVPEYHQNEYLRIKIYGSTWDNDLNTISGQFTIVDKNGNEMAVIERSWTGSYLAIEFTVLNIKGCEYIFPTCIYGKNRILEGKNHKDKGTTLSKYYLDNKKCLLPGNGSSQEVKSTLYKISSFAASSFPIVFPGSRSTYTVDLSKCKTGNFYSIIYTENEGFIIQQL